MPSRLIIKRYMPEYHEAVLIKDYHPDMIHYKKLQNMFPYYEEYFDDSTLIDDLYEQGLQRNEEKLKNNLARAKKRVFTLALCNHWEWFVTLTIDKDKIARYKPSKDQEKLDRYDLPSIYKKITTWLNNYNRDGVNVKYLLVPEQHKDGAWHFHGFITGIPLDDLYRFTISDDIPLKLKSRVQSGQMLCSWEAFRDSFGYTVLEPVKNPLWSAKYITKYVTKNHYKNVRELGAHLYYCSKGLNSSENVYEAYRDSYLPDPDVDGDFCQLKSYNTYKELQAAFPWPFDPERYNN